MTIMNLLQHAEEHRHFAPEEVIFYRGEPGDVMYIVLEGEVDILIDDLVFDTVTPGGIVGEMALIDDKPRSATAMARTICTVAPINEKAFFYLVHKEPVFALEVMRIMADRLRRMNALS